jgi:hypothetical protein
MKRTRLFGVHKETGEYDGWIISCPGCGTSHVLDKRWTFNGNFELPTFRASLLVRTGKYCGSPEWYNSLDGEHKEFVDKNSEICHSFITDGKIQYLDDCTHKLKGQTVDLPEVKEEPIYAS